MRGKESWILVSFRENRNRRSASEELYKIKKTNKGKLGQKTSHIARSKRTHITLPGSCCAGSAKLQKTPILVVSHIDIGIYKALFCVPSCYPVRVNPLYNNSLKFIRSNIYLASARR